MKTNRLNFSPAGVFLTAFIMGTTTLFMSCEPETDELQFADMQITLEMEAKQVMNLTLNKELAALRAYIAPYYNYEEAVEAGYALDITGYRTMVGTIT